MPVPVAAVRQLSNAPPARSRGASPAFDAATLVAGLWFVSGLLLDGWAHDHLDLSAEGFFTPYHAVFYSGFFVVAAVVLIGTLRLRAREESFLAAVPTGYGLTLGGLALFSVGGVLDMLWHLTFGIEQDLAALFSPTHLMLSTGIGLILTGPIRSTIARVPARSLRAQWPAIVALGLFGTLVMFVGMWAYATYIGVESDPQRAFPDLSGDALYALREDWLARGLAAIVIRSLVMVALLVWASRRLALPFGAGMLIVAIPNVSISLMLDASASWAAVILATSLLAGAVADVAFARGVSFEAGSWPSRGVAFGVPFVFWTALVCATLIVAHGSWWVVHALTGAPLIAGAVGLLLAIASERPR